MNKATYELIDNVDGKLNILEMVQSMMSRRAFANYEKAGDECADITIFKEEAAELWALSEMLLEQIKHIREELNPLLKMSSEQSEKD